MYERQYNPYQNNIAIIKNYFKSPAVLALGILNVVSLILAAVNSLVSSSMVKEVITKLVDYFQQNATDGSADYFREISTALNQSSGVNVLTLLSSVNIFGILTAVAILLIYFKSRNNSLDSSPMAGFTILYVVAIFSLIGAILLALLMLLIVILLFAAYAEFSKTASGAFEITVMDQTVRFDASLFLVIAITLAITFIFTAFFSLFFTINRVRYYGSVRNSMNTVELSRKGAKPYGVLLVIFAVGSGISLISSIPAMFIGSSGAFGALEELGITITSDAVLPSIISFITSAVSFAVIVLQAKIALGYARYIDDKKYGYSEPVAAAPAQYFPSNVGVGSGNSQQNPYSYLAQPKTNEKEDPTFVNPYLNSDPEDPLPAAPTCPNCGAEVDPGAPFCGNCGTKL